MTDTEKRILALRRHTGEPRTERLPRTDIDPDCGGSFGKPGPRVDVRVVLFTVNAGRLLVALPEQATSRAIPRGSLIRTENLDAAGTRILMERIGLAERYLEQLYSISHSSKGHWTVTVAYLALVLAAEVGPPLNSVTWSDIENLPEIEPVDRKFVDYALLRVRAKLGYTTIAFHLLPASFSLSDLQIVYEAVLDHEVDKRNFRRRIHAAGVLEGTGHTRREGSHRPARLYRFRAGHDAETYLTPGWAFGTEQGATNP